MITPKQRTHLRQTLGQLKAELSHLQQSLEGAPEVFKPSSPYRSFDGGDALEGYELDDYILKFRLGNVIDLSHHTLDALGLGEKA